MCTQGDEIHAVGMSKFNDAFCRFAFQDNILSAQPCVLQSSNDFLEVGVGFLFLHVPAHRVYGKASFSILGILQHMDYRDSSIGHRSNGLNMRQDTFCQSRSIQWYKDVINHNDLQYSPANIFERGRRHVRNVFPAAMIIKQKISILTTIYSSISLHDGILYNPTRSRQCIYNADYILV